MDGKQPVFKDKLYRYNKGTTKTNLQFRKKLLGSMSMPGLDFEVNLSNSLRISVAFKINENKFKFELVIESDNVGLFDAVVFIELT